MTCSKCGSEGGPRKPCRKCTKEYNGAYYKANRERLLRRHHKARQWLLDYLLSHPCVDCGERDVLVLEFDHRDGCRRGGRTVAESVTRGVAALKAEIARCDVRCANCHQRMTHQRANSWRWNEVMRSKM